MPILPESPRNRVKDAADRFLITFNYATNSSIVASALVAVFTVALWAFKIELQYVAGAVLIYGAQRLVQKRVSPTVLQVPEPPKQRSFREILDPQKQKGPTDA